jgi:hypothetical protein
MCHIFRAVSPDEYDAAVRRSPAACPLHMCGDRRIGRQLLEDGERDAWTPLTAYGPGAFHSIAAVLADSVARLRLEIAAAAAAGPAAAPPVARRYPSAGGGSVGGGGAASLATTAPPPAVHARTTSAPAPLRPGDGWPAAGGLSWAGLVRERWPATPLQALWTFGFRPQVSHLP